MKKLLYFPLLVLLFSCQKEHIDPFVSEYQDWYVLKSPIDRPIEGVWGNYDETILISTTFNVFRSTDQGRNWESVHEVGSGRAAVFGIVQYRDTLFTLHGKVFGNYGEYLTNANHYSIDDGKSWLPYKKYNPFFNVVNYHRDTVEVNKILRIDQATDSDGTSYRIYRDFLDDPIKKQGRFETPGLINSIGNRINLPELHQLSSLYLDAQQRLYITGSDAVCNREPFAFCNSKGGRGVVYVSKRALP